MILILILLLLSLLCFIVINHFIICLSLLSLSLLLYGAKPGNPSGIVYHGYVALAKKTSVLREAMLLLVEPCLDNWFCRISMVYAFVEAMLNQCVVRICISSVVYLF